MAMRKRRQYSSITTSLFHQYSYAKTACTRILIHVLLLFLFLVFPLPLCCRMRAGALQVEVGLGQALGSGEEAKPSCFETARKQVAAYEGQSHAYI